ALAPELGLIRHDRQTVRLHIAVAAAFAHELVDHDPPLRYRHEAALALAMQLRGTSLIVDQRGHAALLAKLPLHLIEAAAVMHADAGRQAHARVVRDLVGHDHDR